MILFLASLAGNFSWLLLIIYFKKLHLLQNSCFVFTSPWTLNKLLKTWKLDEYKLSYFKLDQTQAWWFVFKANSNSIRLEMIKKFKPILGKLFSKLELVPEKWKKLELAICSNTCFEAWWNSNLPNSEYVQALAIYLFYCVKSNGTLYIYNSKTF